MGITIRRSGTSRILAAAALLGTCAFFGLVSAEDRHEGGTGSGTVAAPFDNIIHAHAANLLERGREIFRYDTFGSQDFGEARSSFIRPSKDPNSGVLDRGSARKQRWLWV